MTRVWLALALAASTSFAQAPARPSLPVSLGSPAEARPLAGEVDEKAEEVASLLRCPVCQGLSVADSPSSMAVKMKQQVSELVAAGYSEEQILSYFESSYGSFVRLEPPAKGINWIVWLAPLAALLIGLWIVARSIRKRSPPTDTQSESELDPNRLPADVDLARYVLKVREEAYGWRGGMQMKNDEVTSDE